MQNVCVQNGLKYCPLQHNLNRYKKNPFKFIHTEDNTTIRINWLIIFHFCCCCWSCFLGVFNSRVIKYKLSFVLQSFEIALPARYGTFLQSKDMDGIEPLLHIPEVGFYIWKRQVVPERQEVAFEGAQVGRLAPQVAIRISPISYVWTYFMLYYMLTWQDDKFKDSFFFFQAAQICTTSRKEKKSFLPKIESTFFPVFENGCIRQMEGKEDLEKIREKADGQSGEKGRDLFAPWTVDNCK